jgi:hypothetical protein
MNRWVDTENMLCLHNGILFNHIEEKWNLDIYSQMDKTRKIMLSEISHTQRNKYHT